MNQVMVKVAPALAAGCTMVLKPSQYSPLSALLMAEAVHEAKIPAGVFNLVNGPGSSLGAYLAVAPARGHGLGHRLHRGGGVGGQGRRLVDQAGLAGAGRQVGLHRLRRRRSGEGGRRRSAGLHAQLRAELQRADADAGLDAGLRGGGRDRGSRSRRALGGRPTDPDVFMGPVAGKKQYETVIRYIESRPGRRRPPGGRRARAARRVWTAATSSGRPSSPM